MRKLSFLGLCRRCLLSLFAGESSIGHRRVCSVSEAFYRTPGLRTSSGSEGGFAASFGNRYFHGTGFCCVPQQDYYETLGVSRSASKDEIKKAFRTLAKKYHPDANRDNPSYKRKFQEIREAYETLQDPTKRAEYDMKQSSGYTAGAAEGFRYNYQTHSSTADAEGFGHGYKPHFSSSFHKIFSEIFEHEFDQVAPDIQVELSLSFSEAARGCTKNLSVTAHVPCDSCDGRGYPLKAKTKVCPICRGIGRVTIPPFTSTCSTCKGLGQIIKVAKDLIFARDGADVYVDSNISFTQAILGGKVEVPTLTGKTEVKVIIVMNMESATKAPAEKAPKKPAAKAIEKKGKVIEVVKEDRKSH